MALFPMSCVLRGFSACDVPDVRLGENPCAALLSNMIWGFETTSSLVKPFADWV
jgi:hypothetical protein